MIGNAVLNLSRIVIGVSAASIVSAQLPQDAPPDQAAQQALQFLNRAVEGAASLHVPSNSIYLYASAAQLLQATQPAKAVSMLDKAFEAVNRALASSGNTTAADWRQMSILEDSRYKLVLQVAVINPRHALELFAASQVDDLGSGRYHPDREFKNSLLSRVAQKYPDSVLNLGFDELTAGLLPDALDTYAILRQQSREFAAVLLPAIVSRITAEVPERKSPAVEAAFLLLRQLHEAPSPPESSGEDQAVLGRLMTFVADALLAEKLSDYPLLPEPLESYIASIAPYAPDKAAQLRSRAAAAQGKAPPFKPEQLAAQLENQDYDGALLTAGQAPSQMKTFAFEQIALSSIRRGDMGRAERIVSAAVIDGATRQRIANAVAAMPAHDGDSEARTNEPLPAQQSQAVQHRLSALLAFIRLHSQGIIDPHAVQAEIAELNEVVRQAPHPEQTFGPALASGDEFLYVGFSPIIEIVGTIAGQIIQLETAHPESASALIQYFKQREFRSFVSMEVARFLLNEKSPDPL